ncbi:hypothetical protein [Candidatus Viridilinea mediisalina]|nr:hypothetical protein [Candidatus Viridilinea mediisalina]
MNTLDGGLGGEFTLDEAADMLGCSSLAGRFSSILNSQRRFFEVPA